MFGCGGDRDKGKRPMMGKIAHELSDIVFITNDNPRTENHADIIADVVSGFEKEVYWDDRVLGANLKFLQVKPLRFPKTSRM